MYSKYLNQCIIDLEDNSILFKTANFKCKFLAEHQIKKEKIKLSPQVSGEGNSEAKIKELMNFGFPRNLCEQALRECGGNTEMAASYLFSLPK